MMPLQPHSHILGEVSDISFLRVEPRKSLKIRLDENLIRNRAIPASTSLFLFLIEQAPDR